MASLDNPGGWLPLMEAFYSIQGEGFHQGSPAYFIRLGGCDVGCVWCDVKESWPAEAHPQTAVSEIVQGVRQSGADKVIITGGEPLMYDLTELTLRLKTLPVSIHLETSGSYPLTGSWDWICLSPKKFKKALPAVYPAAHELKVVVYNFSDLAWAEEEARRVGVQTRLFLQPEWSRRGEMTPHIVEFVKIHPRWQISVQIHKYLNVP
jgi:organic radical activating enzyme